MSKEPMFEPLTFTRVPGEQQIERSRQFLMQMQTRRTIRQFSTAPVPFELIQNAITTAGTAPSGANQQPWTFVVVSNAAVKRQIREAAETEEKESYEHRMSEEWLEALAPLGTDWHKAHLEDAPYLIVVFLQAYGLLIDQDTGASHKIKHYYATESVGIAVGMLLCSLHLAGLATLTHTPNPMGFLSQILQRPANERAFVVIPVGYPTEDVQVPRLQKKGINEIMIQIR